MKEVKTTVKKSSTKQLQSQALHKVFEVVSKLKKFDDKTSLVDLYTGIQEIKEDLIKFIKEDV